MNGYGTIETIYRQLGIGVIKKENGEQVIFTAGAVKGGDAGFQDLTEGDKVHYRVSRIRSARSASRATSGRNTKASSGPLAVR